MNAEPAVNAEPAAGPAARVGMEAPPCPNVWNAPPADFAAADVAAADVTAADVAAADVTAADVAAADVTAADVAAADVAAADVAAADVGWPQLRPPLPLPAPCSLLPGVGCGLLRTTIEVVGTVGAAV